MDFRLLVHGASSTSKRSRSPPVESTSGQEPAGKRSCSRSDDSHLVIDGGVHPAPSTEGDKQEDQKSDSSPDAKADSKDKESASYSFPGKAQLIHRALRMALALDSDSDEDSTLGDKKSDLLDDQKSDPVQAPSSEEIDYKQKRWKSEEIEYKQKLWDHMKSFADHQRRFLMEYLSNNVSFLNVYADVFHSEPSKYDGEWIKVGSASLELYPADNWFQPHGRITKGRQYLKKHSRVKFALCVERGCSAVMYRNDPEFSQEEDEPRMRLQISIPDVVVECSRLFPAGHPCSWPAPQFFQPRK